MRRIGSGRPGSGSIAPVKKLDAMGRVDLHRRGSGGSAAAPQRASGGIAHRLPPDRQGSGRYGEVKDRDPGV
jgi:hypothetical protein